jgi:putative hemolysin
VLAVTPAPSVASNAPQAPNGGSGSDSTPWPAILAVVALLVVGVNLAIFQLTRMRRPR